MKSHVREVGGIAEVSIEVITLITIFDWEGELLQELLYLVQRQKQPRPKSLLGEVTLKSIRL